MQMHGGSVHCEVHVVGVEQNKMAQTNRVTNKTRNTVQVFPVSPSVKPHPTKDLHTVTYTQYSSTHRTQT